MNASTPNFNESKVLMDIENFIISMTYENYTEQGFKDGLMQLIPQFKAIYQPHLKYAQSVETFHSLTKAIDEMLNGEDISVVRHLTPMQM
ncbi:hypothetical protein [Acinetobacter haemolyticus]|nr:hypothetical protein [Acinetobacter haemolyticus]